jgi:hypothetical protein
MAAVVSGLDVFWLRCEGPIVMGLNDCCVTVADVLKAEGGPDLMADYRGTYSNDFWFLRQIRRRGFTSLREAATDMLERHGKQVQQARDFDVAVVSYATPQGNRHAPAFHHSGFWNLRSEAGMFCSQGHPEAVYRVI